MAVCPWQFQRELFFKAPWAWEGRYFEELERQGWSQDSESPSGDGVRVGKGQHTASFRDRVGWGMTECGRLPGKEETVKRSKMSSEDPL